MHSNGKNDLEPEFRRTFSTAFSLLLPLSRILPPPNLISLLPCFDSFRYSIASLRFLLVSLFLFDHGVHWEKCYSFSGHLAIFRSWPSFSVFPHCLTYYLLLFGYFSLFFLSSFQLSPQKIYGKCWRFWQIYSLFLCFKFYQNLVQSKIK